MKRPHGHNGIPLGIHKEIQMEKDNKMETIKKLGLFSLIAFCMGDTIGAGIFSSLPYAVSLVGSGGSVK